MQTRLTNCELWKCLKEAEERKANKELPLGVRVRSMETYTVCLREAHNRGYDYGSLKHEFDPEPHAES